MNEGPEATVKEEPIFRTEEGNENEKHRVYTSCVEHNSDSSTIIVVKTVKIKSEHPDEENTTTRVVKVEADPDDFENADHFQSSEDFVNAGNSEKPDVFEEARDFNTVTDLDILDELESLDDFKNADISDVEETDETVNDAAKPDQSTKASDMTEFVTGRTIDEEHNYSTRYRQTMPNQDVSKKTKFYCDECDYCCYTSESLKSHKLISHEIVMKVANSAKAIQTGEVDDKSGLAKERNDDAKCDEDTKYIRHLLNYTRENTKHRPFVPNHPQVHTFIYYCDECDFRSKTPGSLKFHKLTHKTDVLQCDKCEKVFKHALSLYKHDLHIHQKVKPFKCDVCDYTCSTLHSLQSHQQVHTFVFYRCDTCGKIIKRLQNLKKHMRLKHKTNPNKYYPQMADKDIGQLLSKSCICVVCNQEFKTKHLLMIHMQTHKRTCPKCERTFSSAGTLKKHMNTHSDEGQSRPYKCRECEKAYTENSNLNRHMALVHHMDAHTDTHSESKSFTCDCCNKGFASEFHLRKHKYNRMRDKNHVCATCGAHFDCRSRLVYHEVKHSNNKPFVCKICDARYPREKSLKRHILSHTDSGKPSWQCSICGKTFLYKDALTSHELYVHSDEKPWCCDLCGSVFKRSRDLKRHLGTHNEHLNYECKTCGRKFRQQSNLTKHMRVHNDPVDIRRERNRKRYLKKKQRLQKRAEEAKAKAPSCVTDNLEKQNKMGQGNIEMEENFVMGPNRMRFATDENVSELNRVKSYQGTNDKHGQNLVMSSEHMVDLNVLVKPHKKDGIDFESTDMSRNKDNDTDNYKSGDDAYSKSRWSNNDVEMIGSSLSAKGEFVVDELMELTTMDSECQNDSTSVVIYESKENEGNEFLSENYCPMEKVVTKEEDHLNIQKCSTVDKRKHDTHKTVQIENLNKSQQPQNSLLDDVNEPPIITVTEENQTSVEYIMTLTPDRKFKEMIKIEKIGDEGIPRWKSEFKKKLENERKLYQCKFCPVSFRLYDSLLMHLVHVHGVEESVAQSMSDRFLLVSSDTFIL